MHRANWADDTPSLRKTIRLGANFNSNLPQSSAQSKSAMLSDAVNAKLQQRVSARRRARQATYLRGFALPAAMFACTALKLSLRELPKCENLDQTTTFLHGITVPDARFDLAGLKGVVGCGSVLRNSRASGRVELAALYHISGEVHWNGVEWVNQKVNEIACVGIVKTADIPPSPPPYPPPPPSRPPEFGKYSRACSAVVARAPGGEREVRGGVGKERRSRRKGLRNDDHRLFAVFR